MDAPAPVVSVIIPAYNAQATILEAVRSLQQQSFADFEIVVIDDGSTDATSDHLATIDDPRLRIFPYSNAGLETARNRGIGHARGRFISFLDADDVWTEDKLELQLAALDRRPDAGVAYSWTAFIDEAGRFLFAKEPIHADGYVLAELLRHNFVGSGSNVLMRRECVNSVGLFDVELRHCSDWDHLLRAAHRWPFVVVPRYQILYRLSHASMSSRVDTMERGMLTVLQQALETAPPDLRHCRRQCLAGVEQYLAFLYLARTAMPDWRLMAGRKLYASVRLYPPILWTWKTQKLFWTWLATWLVPDWLARRIVRGLLRLYGRAQFWLTPQLRMPAIRRWI